MNNCENQGSTGPEQTMFCEGCDKPIKEDEDYVRTLDDVYLHLECAEGLE